MRMETQTLRSAGALVGAATLAFGALWLLAQPDNARARLANVAAVAARVEQGAAGVEPPMAPPCRTALTEAADQVQASLGTVAGQSGVTLEALELAALPAVTADLEGLKLAVRLRGTEAAFTTFLRRVSEARLPVFLDGADVQRTAAGGLSAELDARILCRRGGR